MKGIKLCAECANYSLNKHRCMLGCRSENDVFDAFYDDCPLPDVAPIIHAHWIPIDDGAGAECGHCGEYYDVCVGGGMEMFNLFTKFYRYCPNCGAKMDEETKREDKNND